MRTVIVRDAMRIPLGKQGENNAVRVVWPEIAEKYAKLYGEGRFELVVVQRGQVYPAVVNVDGADLVWDVRAADTATAEVGSLELIYYVGDTIAKSQTWETVVVASASAAGTTEPPEDPARVWFDEIKRQIGDLGKLTTKAKENLVGAINEAAQTSSGGGGGAKEFRLIRNITLDEQSDRVDISEDSNGSAFALHEVYAMLAAQSYEDVNAEVHFLPNGRWGARDAYITSANRSSKSSETWKNNMAFHAVYADGIICSEQLPTKGQNQNLTFSFATNQAIITKISIVCKLAAGCTFLVIGR